MSNEPKYLADNDRAWGRLQRQLDIAQYTAYRSGYEAGRIDERAGAPHRFKKTKVRAEEEVPRG